MGPQLLTPCNAAVYVVLIMRYLSVIHITVISCVNVLEGSTTVVHLSVN